MKRKILFLMGVMSLSNFSIVSACFNSDIKHELELVPPKTYNLNSELLDLNKLDFKIKNSNKNLEKYQFQNSWFFDFVSNDNKAFFKENKNRRYQEKKYYSYFFKEIKNNENTAIDTIVKGETIPVYPNLLFISRLIDIKQEFTIVDNGFINGYTIKLGPQPRINFGNIKETIRIPDQSIKIDPHKTMVITRDLFLDFTIFEGLLKFSLNKDTKIAYQVENIITKEKTVYFYTINDLLARSNDREYQKILTKKDTFLYYHNNDILMQLKFAFSKITRHFINLNIKEKQKEIF